MAGKYQFRRDSWNRLQTDIGESLTIAIKMLSETDERRMLKKVHAYVILDIRTEFGPLRVRDIRVQWSEKNQQHFIRWRQWNTGRVRDGRDEYLDVCGPLDGATRNKFGDTILDVFAQIKEEAAAGTLGKANPQLQVLKARLELEQAPETNEADEAAEEVAQPEA